MRSIVLMLMLMVSCGKKDEKKSSVNQEALTASDCIQYRLASHYCYYTGCTLAFYGGLVKRVPYGVYYNNHVYKICSNGIVYP